MPAGRIRSFAGSWAVCALASVLLTACGGGGSSGAAVASGGGGATYTVGGAVNGLSASGLVLQLNGSENLPVASGANAFTFSAALPAGSSYAVTVATQPTGETCAVTQGSGTVGSANVDSVTVSCTSSTPPPVLTYTIGGVVSGLSASGLQLDLNGGNPVQVPAGSATFKFAVQLTAGSNYVVSVVAQPVGESCVVTQGSGTVGTANVDSVTVSCASSIPPPVLTYTIGGVVSGLSASGLQLDLNGGNPVQVPAGSATFKFPVQLTAGSNYVVTVAAQPTGESCTVAQGSGTVGSANVDTVVVSCVVNTYFIGGSVSGLVAPGLTVALNGANPVQIASGSTTFKFATALPAGSNYLVTVTGQPVGETCSVAQGAGTVGSANITSVRLSCSGNTYTIGGAVTGLNASGLVLALNGGSDLPVPSGAGSFTFATALASGASYSVTVATQPTGEICAATQATGTVASTNVVSVSIACSVETFTVSGTVSNLSTAGLNLRDAVGGEILAVPAGASTFTFAQPLPYGTDIALTVTAQPSWQTCAVSASNFSGPIHANVTAESISCTAVTATVSTLAGSTTAGSQDGAGAAAAFFHPDGVAVDAAGNVYVADEYNDLIRRVTPAGVVSTLAGTAGVSGSTDGVGTAALFYHPQGVAVDSAGAIYVADTFNDEIRKIVCTGSTASTCTVSTVAGSTTPGHADGTGPAASFNHPEGIAVDALGNVYVADSLNDEIREISPGGLVTTLAGSTVAGNVDGSGTSAEFNFPVGIAIDSAGTIFVADYNNNEIREISSSDVVSTLAGSGASGDVNGAGAAASFWGPQSVAVDSAGNVYVADSLNDQIRLITPGGAVSTFAGSTLAGSTDGAASSALFNNPSGIVTNASGDVLIGDYGNNEIRQIAP